MLRERRLMFVAALAALAVLVSGALWLGKRQSADRFAQCRQTAVTGGLDQFGGSFRLTDENGTRVTDAEVFSKPALLYFGYTFCPDVCPVDSARNALAAEELRSKGYDIGTVFITVDPKRDTPEALRDFTDAMDPEMLGLTGTEEEIASVNKLWRNYYKSHDDGSDPYYLVDHMTNSYLVLPQFGTVEFFGRDVSPEDMATRVACFLDAGR